ncbi:polynucleotide adenylyltransferase PcnB [Geotalea sp. SG265]|uniref:polynucleotide adenylyltransferase PcnB n=1 Tax=Geotalea sp. SG265 TaxID=2922867 RepID=UPI001FAFC32A|nr:polynucleotide adenylyltransferase PcnB [Geotalea sp. SG265]
MEPLKPLIIPRADHTISRRSLSPNAVRVLYRLKDNGFTAYLVGGGVRDLLLGREPKDFDIVTNATPVQIKKMFRNCRLIGRRFRLAHLHFHDEIVEVATFRSARLDDMPADESLSMDQPEGRTSTSDVPRLLKSEDGMVLRDNIFGTPEEDAVRRDFTVNALAYNISDFSLIDYVGGLEDLQRGVIRTIGDPAVRFVEDPVRMIRAVRFAAMLGFSIEGTTWHTILELGATVTKASPPRLYEEVLKLLLLGAAERTYQLLRQSGIFAALFPHFSRWLDRESDGFPHTWVGKALDHVDVLLQNGEKVQPPLLFALMFGQYLQEKADRFRKEGLPAHPAVNAAVAEFMGEVSPTVQFPNRVAILMRDILTSQYRLRKIPGRHPETFATRHGFAEALAYLRFMANVTGEDAKIVNWWEKFRLEPQPEIQQEGEPRQKRRRRRKRRKKPSQDHSEGVD